MSDLQPQPLPDNTPIAVTLTVVQWRTVLNLLAEGAHPLRITGPLYSEIERQCNAHISRAQRGGNGELHETLPT